MRNILTSNADNVPDKTNLTDELQASRRFAPAFVILA
jgi:hypothetical protein